MSEKPLENTVYPRHLRDWFAGQALAALLSRDDIRRVVADFTNVYTDETTRNTASVCYAFADAMLEIREREHQKRQSENQL